MFSYRGKPKTQKKSRQEFKPNLMKKFSPLISLAIIAFIAINFIGCSKDDSSTSVEKKLVIVKRSNGKLFTVDKITGNLAEIGHITLDGDSLRGLRCLVYDPATGKAFAGSTNDDNGNLYSINLKTGVATLLNDNPDENWDAISGLLVEGDSLIANMYSNIVYNTALTRFSKTSGEYGLHRNLTDGDGNELWSVGGTIYGSDKSHLILGGVNELYYLNSMGIVTDTIPLVPTTNINDEDLYVMAMAKENSTVYGLVFEYNEKNHYLVKLDTETGELTEIKFLINGGNTASYHCLALIPENVLP